MPKKNYHALRVGQYLDQARQEKPIFPGRDKVADLQTRLSSEADIDMLALLGPEARFSTPIRTVKLSKALGRNIDEWVFATADALRKRLAAGLTTASASNAGHAMTKFFDFLTEGATPQGLTDSKPATPANLKPLHIHQFIGWLKKRGGDKGWVSTSIRACYSAIKGTLIAMFDLGFIPGHSSQFFRYGNFEPDVQGRTTSMSEAEQERLARAIKVDLSAIHHGRLKVSMRELQAIRFLVVAHRMGHNTTPLLELQRDAVTPGLLPGTVQIQTTKHRSKKVNSQMGFDGSNTPANQTFLPFSLAEGAVISQAIESTKDLVARAPQSLKNRVWLYELAHTTGRVAKGSVSALTAYTVLVSVRTLVKRHELRGDDGKKLVVNASRLRKSRFDRAFRINDGDLVPTANLMGNTPTIAGSAYPSMNTSRTAEAADFMNVDYIDLMRKRGESAVGDEYKVRSMRVIKISPSASVQNATPVAGCADSLGGEYAPNNGNLCDRFVMCLFCSSFAIVGTVDELWRLFSFQFFARAELAHLESNASIESLSRLGHEHLQELRDRYKLSIPYIDSFTKKQFAAKLVELARAKTDAGLHPFWVMQMDMSRRARTLNSGGFSA